VCGFGTSGFSSSDVTVPTVSMLDPLQGTTVSGVASVSATAGDDIGVVGVQLKVDGRPIGNELSALPYVASWDSSTVPNGTHILTATVRDATGNAATSAPVTITTSNAPSVAACPVSTSIWQNKLIATESAQFQAIFDATPNLANMDGVTGFSLGTADAYARLAISVRFNSSGSIDARNGANYAANSSVPYLPGQNYHFRLIINPSTHLYTVFVTPPGSPEITLGTNFAFQIAYSRLNYWVLYSELGSHTVCNFALGAVTPAPDFSVSVSPGSQTVTAGSSAITSVSVGSLNGFNGSVNLSASGLPSGTTAAFSPATVVGSGASTLTIKTTVGTPTGPHEITITGTSGAGTRSTTYTLKVSPAPATQYETESAAVFNASKSSGPAYRIFAWTGFTNGQGTTLDATAAGQSVTITLNVAAAGNYDVKFATKAHSNRAMVQLKIKGVNVGPAADEYSASDVWKQFDLGTVSLPAGNVAFAFTSTGKNHASSGFTQAFDYIKLTPE
jgi:Bacterial Ig domain